jgi:hypothetical protein
LCFLARGATASDFVRSQEPIKLSFQELLQLAVADPLPLALDEHLQHLLSEPSISNEATFSGAKSMRPEVSSLGPILRVAEWNIERGINQPQVVMSFSHDGRFEHLARQADTRASLNEET